MNYYDDSFHIAKNNFIIQKKKYKKNYIQQLMNL